MVSQSILDNLGDSAYSQAPGSLHNRYLRNPDCASVIPAGQNFVMDEC